MSRSARDVAPRRRAARTTCSRRRIEVRIQNVTEEDGVLVVLRHLEDAGPGDALSARVAANFIRGELNDRAACSGRSRAVTELGAHGACSVGNVLRGG